MGRAGSTGSRRRLGWRVRRTESKTAQETRAVQAQDGDGRGAAGSFIARGRRGVGHARSDGRRSAFWRAGSDRLGHSQPGGPQQGSMHLARGECILPSPADPHPSLRLQEGPRARPCAPPSPSEHPSSSIRPPSPACTVPPAPESPACSLLLPRALTDTSGLSPAVLPSPPRPPRPRAQRAPRCVPHPGPRSLMASSVLEGPEIADVFRHTALARDVCNHAAPACGFVPAPAINGRTDGRRHQRPSCTAAAVHASCSHLLALFIAENQANIAQAAEASTRRQVSDRRMARPGGTAPAISRRGPWVPTPRACRHLPPTQTLSLPLLRASSHALHSAQRATTPPAASVLVWPPFSGLARMPSDGLSCSAIQGLARHRPPHISPRSGGGVALSSIESPHCHSRLPTMPVKASVPLGTAVN